MKRKSLTVADKHAIIEEKNNPTLTMDQLAYKHGVAKSTISGILGPQRSKIKDAFSKGTKSSKIMKFRKISFEDVDRNLFNWCIAAFSDNIEGLSEQVLLGKAKSIAAELSHLDNDKLNISWIQRFKKRHSIVHLKQCGEASSVSLDIVETWKSSVLHSIISTFAEKDIFNLDETALFWEVLPEKTMGFRGQRCHGGKKSKKRITLLLGANANGTEKLDPLVIGKFAKPRCFKNARLPIDYENNKRAWMTGDLFTKYIQKLDRHFHYQKRKVAVVLDNCPAHPQTYSNLQAIQVFFLPPNSTSLLQPLDAGIIRSFKHEYRKLLAQKRLMAYDAQCDFKFNLLDALTLIKKAWNFVSQETIKNCYLKCGFKDQEVMEISELEELPDLVDGKMEVVWARLLECNLRESEFTFDDYIELDNQVITSATLDEFVVDNVSQIDESDSDMEAIEENSENINLEIEKPTLKECLDALSILRRRSHFENDAFSTGVDSLENELAKTIEKSRMQTTIVSYFN